MKRRSIPAFIRALTGTACLFIASVTVEGRQAASVSAPPMAVEVGRNIQVFNGVPAYPFLGTVRHATPTPADVDYDDDRDVVGVTVPFRRALLWQSRRDEPALIDLQPNLPIDAMKFAGPVAPRAP